MPPNGNGPSPLSYAHIPRPDSSIDGNVSSLGQALGNHLPPTRPTFQDTSFRISSSPSAGPSQNQASSSNSHSPLFSVNGTGVTSPLLKRKQAEAANGAMAAQKRRREGDDTDYDGELGAGSKHWTDEEKSKLFTWLMGPGNDEHWNALRATKNSCLRDCAGDVFGGKKTYQALKGCYERNFNLFRQIYSFETYNAHNGAGPIHGLPESDRIREHERRLQTARKSGCDIGNLSARVVDHWHRVGWYDLFYRRWHGDPATTRLPVAPPPPPPPRQATLGPAGPNIPADDPDVDDDAGMEYSDTSIGMSMNGISQDLLNSVNFVNTQNMRESIPPPLPATPNNPVNNPVNMPSSTPSTSSEQSPITLTITNSMLAQYMQYLQAQTQHSRMKLDYLRRREEREEKESSERRELERLRLEREAAEFEHKKQSAHVKEKADRAVEILGNSVVDPSVKQAAGDYLKKLFMSD